MTLQCPHCGHAVPLPPPPPIGKGKDILARVAGAAGMTTEALRAPGRRHNLARLRWAAAWRLAREGLSLTQIGTIIRRDHSTVVHGLRQAAADPSLVAWAQSLLHKGK